MIFRFRRLCRQCWRIIVSAGVRTILICSLPIGGKAFGADSARRKVLHPIREKLGIPRGAFHAFRHGHATIMFSEGANPKVVQESMGHANIKTTMRYTHAISNDRREAVERATQVFVRRSAVNLTNKSFAVN